MTSTGVHNSGLLDHEAILHELADVLTRVGVGDLVDFIGVEPDLSLSTLEHGGSKSMAEKRREEKTRDRV